MSERTKALDPLWKSVIIGAGISGGIESIIRYQNKLEILSNTATTLYDKIDPQYLEKVGSYISDNMGRFSEIQSMIGFTAAAYFLLDSLKDKKE